MSAWRRASRDRHCLSAGDWPRRNPGCAARASDGDVISDEARAKHQEFTRHGVTSIYTGLEDGQRVLESGKFTVFVGSGQPGWAEGVQTTIEIRA